MVLQNWKMESAIRDFRRHDLLIFWESASVKPHSIFKLQILNIVAWHRTCDVIKYKER